MKEEGSHLELYRICGKSDTDAFVFSTRLLKGVPDLFLVPDKNSGLGLVHVGFD